MDQESTETLEQMEQKQSYVYILLCENGSYYTGWTYDVQARYQKHLMGKGAKYTKAHRPIQLLYLEPCWGKPEAMRREIQIKRMTRAQKIKLIFG